MAAGYGKAQRRTLALTFSIYIQALCHKYFDYLFIATTGGIVQSSGTIFSFNVNVSTFANEEFGYLFIVNIKQSCSSAFVLSVYISAFCNEAFYLGKIPHINSRMDSRNYSAF